MPLFVQFKPEEFIGTSILVQVEDERGIIGRQKVPLLRPGKMP
jgi:hypothetical protein